MVGRAILARMSLRHGNGATLELVTVKLGDGLASRLVIGHLNEAEALALVRHAVHDDTGRRDLAILAEKVIELLLLGVEVQFSDKDVHSLEDKIKKGIEL